MSTKRQAETHLGPDNWDQEEPEEKEEGGGFKMAPKEVLEKRVIRTAKRRSQATGDAMQKPVFSGFSGFNKAQKSSFDFLANLTNGSKPNNGSTSTTDTATVSSSSMISKPSISSPSGGIFSLSATSTPIAKSPFGLSTQTTSSAIFGVTGTTPAFAQSVFSSSKPDSTVNDNPFKGQSSVSSASFTFKSSSTPDKPVSQVSSSLFGVPSGNTNLNNTPLSTKTINNPVTTPFKAPVTNTPVTTEANKSVNKDVKDEKDLLYYSHLKALNESVLAWIKKHVEASPVCILTPIFRDYEKHLKGIQDTYDKGKDQSPNKNVPETKDNNTTTNTKAKESKTPVTLTGNTQGSKLFSNTPATSKSLFSLSPSTTISTVEKTTNFKFGINTSTTSSAKTCATTATTSNFTFGINTSTTTSANTFATTATASTAFSFGIKPSSTGTSPFAITTTSPFSATTTSSVGVTTTSPFGVTTTSPFAVTTTSSVVVTTTSPFGVTTTSPFAVTTTSSVGVTTTSPFGVTTTSPFAVNTTSSVGVTTTSPFGITTISPFAVTTTSTFAVTTTSPFAATTTSPFAATTTTSPSNSTRPFSFGIGKPFAFNSNIKKDEGPSNENTNDEDNEDEPPKVEYTPIAEENSVYDKKCKVFEKKEGNFVDKGVGTLYIKKIEETGKHQLLIRANTSLGNILVNLILSSSLPTQRMGKNNVMMVCMPTPDSKPPPTSILIRVKTSEDADELLENLNKYKA